MLKISSATIFLTGEWTVKSFELLLNQLSIQKASIKLDLVLTEVKPNSRLAFLLEDHVFSKPDAVSNIVCLNPGSEFSYFEAVKYISEKCKTDLVIFISNEMKVISDRFIEIQTKAFETDLRCAAIISNSFVDSGSNVRKSRSHQSKAIEFIEAMKEYDSYVTNSQQVHFLKENSEWRKRFNNFKPWFEILSFRRNHLLNLDIGSTKSFSKRQAVSMVLEKGYLLAYSEKRSFAVYKRAKLSYVFGKAYDSWALKSKRSPDKVKMRIHNVFVSSFRGYLLDLKHLFKSRNYSKLHKLKYAFTALPYEFAYNSGKYFGLIYRSLPILWRNRFSYKSSAGKISVKEINSLNS